MAVRIPGINIDEYYQQLGPIEPLIRDDRVTEIMVNGNDHVYVEMAGKVVLTNIKFVDEDQLLNVIQFIVRTVGRRIDERSPLCDARLADGSRVNAVIRPLALNGPLLTIRKFSRDPYQVDDLTGSVRQTRRASDFSRLPCFQKRTSSSRGGPAPGRRPSSTCCRASSRSRTASSQSRTRPSFSCTRSTSAGWSRGRRPSTAKRRSPSSAS